MNSTPSCTVQQLHPRKDPRTPICAARLIADNLKPGEQLLYIANSPAGARRMLAADHRAAYHRDIAVGAKIVVLQFDEELREDEVYKYVLADVQVYSSRVAKEAWTTFLESIGPTRLYIFESEYRRTFPSLKSAKKQAEQVAKFIGAEGKKVWDASDDKYWALARANHRSWVPPLQDANTQRCRLYPSAEDVDLKSELPSVDLHAIRIAADALWVTEGREYKRIKAFERWAGRRLTDEDVLCELRYRALDTLRGLQDPTWSHHEQEKELHPEAHDDAPADEEDYALHRVNHETRRAIWDKVLELLGWSAQAGGGLPIECSREDASRIRSALFDIGQELGWVGIRIIAPMGGSLQRAMLEDTSEMQDRYSVVRGILTRIGYTEGTRRVSRASRAGPREVEASWLPRVPKSGFGFRTQVEPGEYGENTACAKSSIIGSINRCFGACGEIAKFSALVANSKSECAFEACIPAFFLDVDAWNELGAPGRKEDGVDRDGPYAAVRAFTQDQVVWVPDPARRKGAEAHPHGRQWSTWPRTAGLVRSIVQAVSKSHRHLLQAIPGRTLVGFDFSNAHIHIAAGLAQGPGRPNLLSQLTALPDIYGALSAEHGVERSHLKVILLTLLNGGEDLRDHLPHGWEPAQVQAFKAALQRHLQPWYDYTKGLMQAKVSWAQTRAESHKTPKQVQRSRGALAMQAVERRLLDAVIARAAQELPELRLLVTMYDGALFDVETTDEDTLVCLRKRLGDLIADVVRDLGFAKILAKVHSGLTWSAADGR